MIDNKPQNKSKQIWKGKTCDLVKIQKKKEINFMGDFFRERIIEIVENINDSKLLALIYGFVSKLSEEPPK